MRFNLSLKGRRVAGVRDESPVQYTAVRAGVPDGQVDLYRALLAVGFSDDPALPLSGNGLAMRRELQATDPELARRMAIYLDELGFPKPAYWVSAELAAANRKDEAIALVIARIVRQPQQVPEWLAYFRRAAGSGAKPGRGVRKALEKALHLLEEYAFSRYGREMQAAIRGAVDFLRPKAGDPARKALFARVLRDQIAPRETWEEEWHALHHQHYDSPERRQVVLRDKWKEGISSFRIGYAPLLDNLRPMLCAGVSGKVLKLAAEYLGNASALRKSGVSPLSLLENWKTLRKMEQGGAGMLSEALENAVLHHAWADFGHSGHSVIAMDISNSMKRPVYPGGSAQRFDIAPLLAGLWKARGYAVTAGIIGNSWKPLALAQRPVLSATHDFRSREGEAGYGINVYLLLQDLLRRGKAVDRILVFTDSRIWGRRDFNQAAGADLVHWWARYRREIAPGARLYLFDLAGYGAEPIECPGEDVFLIAGWKEGIPGLLSAMEGQGSKFIG